MPGEIAGRQAGRCHRSLRRRFQTRGNLFYVARKDQLTSCAVLPICFRVNGSGSEVCCKWLERLVGATGIEPVTPTMST